MKQSPLLAFYPSLVLGGADMRDFAVATYVASHVVIGFFFSSRRRHTRWTGDWSSDVCSSDLAPLAGVPPVPVPVPAWERPASGQPPSGQPPLARPALARPALAQAWQQVWAWASWCSPQGWLAARPSRRLPPRRPRMAGSAPRRMAEPSVC